MSLPHDETNFGIGNTSESLLQRRLSLPVISRQKLIGWILIAVSAAYIAYFLRVRLLEVGPAAEKQEWVQLIGSVVVLMLGTINVRLAAMRRR